MKSHRALVVAAPQQIAPVLAAVPVMLAGEPGVELVYRSATGQLLVFRGSRPALRALVRHARAHGLHAEALANARRQPAHGTALLAHFRGKGWFRTAEAIKLLGLSVGHTHDMLQSLVAEGRLLRAGTYCHTVYLVAGPEPIPPPPREVQFDALRQMADGGRFTTAQAKPIFGSYLNAQRAVAELVRAGRVVRAGTIGTGRAYRFVEEPTP